MNTIKKEEAEEFVKKYQSPSGKDWMVDKEDILVKFLTDFAESQKTNVSDEEIKHQADKCYLHNPFDYSLDALNAFCEGAKWMRDNDHKPA